METKPLLETLGQELKDAREKIQKISIGHLARTTGLNKSTISRIEAGELTPSKETLEKLTSTLELNHQRMCILAGHLPDDLALLTTQFIIAVGADKAKELMMDEVNKAIF